jgi:hypothetical protein
MLTIRDAQMAAFAKAAREQFSNMARDEMQALWPEVCAQFDSESLVRIIRDSIREAEEFGLTSDRSILRYLNIVFAFVPGSGWLAHQQWAQDILQDQDLSGEEKVDAILDYLRNSISQ